MRIVVSCFVLLLSSLVAAGDLKIYTYAGLQGVEDSDGRVVVPAIYERLGWSNGANDIVNQTIGFYENGNWGLINIRTKKVGSARYKILEPFNESLFEAGKLTHYSNVVRRGLINDRGEVIVDFNYYTISELFPDAFKVSVYSDKDLLFGLVGGNGVLIPIQYENLRAVGDIIEAGNKGLMKRLYASDGSFLIDEWVDAVDKVSDGYVVRKEGYFGRLDRNGRLELPIKYKSITADEAEPFPVWQVTELANMDLEKAPFEIGCDSITLDTKHNILIAHVNNAEHILAASDLLFSDQNNSLKSIKNGFLVTKNNKLQKWGIYKTDGREIAFGFDSVAVDSLYFYANSHGEWDVYNMFGRKINEPSFQEVSFASNRNVPVKRNNFWGWLDFRGNVLLNYTFDKVAKTSNQHHFLAKNYGSWGVSDFNGDWVILAEYDSIYSYGPYYVGQKGQASYVMNQEGEILHSIPFETDPKDYLQLKNGVKVGAITATGYYVHPQYESIQRFGEYYELKDSVYVRLVHQNGREVLDLSDEVQDVFGFSEGYFHILKDGKHGFIDVNGKLRIANRYDEAQIYSEGLAPVQLLGKWGFIDKSEVLRIQPFYRYSSTFVNDLAIVQTGDDFGLITPSGKEVVEVRWKSIERLPTGNYIVMDWDNKVGLCDINGRFIVRPNFDSIVDTDKELLIVSKNGVKGILDYNGYTKLPFEYVHIKVIGEYLLMQQQGQD